jgi:hypothetical protein
MKKGTNWFHVAIGLISIVVGTFVSLCLIGTFCIMFFLIARTAWRLI